MSVACAPAACPGQTTTVPAYEVSRLVGLDDFLARCSALAEDGSLPFHSVHWLRAWYEALGHSQGWQPLWVAVRRSGASRDALLLPLVQRRRWGITQLMFADAGVVDYVAPLVAPDWAGGAPEPEAAAALWQALRAALPGDVLVLEKMLARGLAETGQRANPLSLALPVRVSEQWGNQFEVTGDWDGWRRSLDKRVRKEIERCWRVFHRSEAARFERITDPQRAGEIFAVLEQQQSQRLTSLGVAYRLDQPDYRAFYRQLLRDGLADGSVVLTALLDGPHVVSALFGLANRWRYIGLRQSLGGDAWKTCSPGRLLDEHTARHMHEAARRHFDFGVGDYFHKATLQMAQIPLLDARVALSARGWPLVAVWRLKRWLKCQTWLMQAWRRWQARGTAAQTGGQRTSAPAHRPTEGGP